MSGNRLSYIIILCAVLLAAGGYFALTKDAPKYKWSERLHLEEDQPYDFKVLRTLLDSSEVDVELVDHKISNVIDSTITGADYFFVGGSRYNVDSAEVAYLLAFAERGNNVFFATNYLPRILWDSLNFTSRWDYYSAKEDIIRTSVVAHLEGDEKAYPFTFHNAMGPTNRSWDILDPDYLLSDVEVVGRLDSAHQVNFIRVPYGKGHFYYHCEPLLFTNYYLITENGFDYANGVLSQMNLKKVYWDVYNTEYHRIAGKNRNSEDSVHFKKSPLNFMLENRSFRWAWYLSLVLVGLYLFVQARRKQRIIPIILPPKNSSLEYARALGALFFKGEDHTLISREMMRQFWLHVRTTYRINRKREDREKLVALIASKSATPQEVVSEIITFDERIRNRARIDHDELSRLNQLLETYYGVEQEISVKS